MFCSHPPLQLADARLVRLGSRDVPEVRIANNYSYYEQNAWATGIVNDDSMRQRSETLPGFDPKVQLTADRVRLYVISN